MYDRYNAEKGSQLFQYISKQLKYRTSKNRDSRNFSSTKPTNVLNSSDLYSQPQIIKPRRGASIFRNSSNNKYAESMGKFRKDFIKEYINYDQNEGNRKKTTKEDNSKTVAGLNFDEEIGVQELHYQMVRLHQNVKKMQKEV